jgi:hypothetical protein
MAWFGRTTLWRPLVRRIPASLALVSYLITALGFPLPAAGRKEADQPFPCQNHPCGCLSAEQCWRSCCCFTPEQRWAWAREHHVKPPAYAEPPQQDKGWSTHRLRDRAGGKATTQAACACCQPALTAKSCCAAQKDRRSCHESVDHQSAKGSRPPSRPGVRWALGMAAQHCQGLSTLWVSGGAVLPPPARLAWNPYLAPEGWLAYPDSLPLGLSIIPPDPPPRLPHA